MLNLNIRQKFVIEVIIISVTITVFGIFIYQNTFKKNDLFNLTRFAMQKEKDTLAMNFYSQEFLLTLREIPKNINNPENLKYYRDEEKKNMGAFELFKNQLATDENSLNTQLLYSLPALTIDPDYKTAEDGAGKNLVSFLSAYSKLSAQNTELLKLIDENRSSEVQPFYNQNIAALVNDYQDKINNFLGSANDRQNFISSAGITEQNKIDDMMLTLLVSLILTSLVLNYLINIPISRAIKLLSRTAEQISAGNMELRAQVESKDEIGSLATNFNKMTEYLVRANRKLEAAKANLEFKVEERTADLKKFKQAIENTSDLVVITDEEGSILYVNPAAKEITGYEASEMINKKSAFFGKIMDKKSYAEMIKKAKTDKSTIVIELEGKKKSGGTYVGELHISPVFNEKSEIKFFVGIERDITRAKEIDRMKTEFISVASHQLRTPLTIIDWYLEMLLSGDGGQLTKNQKELVMEVDDGAKRMTQLVNDLLNVSRFESGRLKIDPKPTQLEDFIDQLFHKEIKPMAASKHCAVKFTKPKNKMSLIAVDPELMRHVVTNLTSNAIKYSSPADKGEVEIKLENVDKIPADQTGKEKYALISVRDNGVGIPADNQKRIFERFFRAENVTKIDTQGTGLGLYIAKQIIEAAGGKIWFESIQNKGTTFFVAISMKGMTKKEGEKSLA